MRDVLLDYDLEDEAPFSLGTHGSKSNDEICKDIGFIRRIDEPQLGQSTQTVLT